jgi:hypothetical protein
MAKELVMKQGAGTGGRKQENFPMKRISSGSDHGGLEAEVFLAPVAEAAGRSHRSLRQPIRSRSSGL